jgi:hypothetical protein
VVKGSGHVHTISRVACAPANGDWLPIMLRFNEDTEMFEGQASLGSRRLGVDYSVVIDMMSGGQGEHVASVLYG